MKSIGIILFFCVFISCKEVNKKENTSKGIEKCPCDSIGRFSENGKIDIEYYFGKSMIGIKGKVKNDTISVTRYYTTDTQWHVQEYILVANGKIVHPKFSIYCSITDTASFYKITFIKNDSLKRNPDLVFKKNLAVKAIINSDTISSENLSVLIPKEKFNGIIKLDKEYSSLYKNKAEIFISTIYIDSEKMIKYGDLLEQYKAINKACEATTTTNH